MGAEPYWYTVPYNADHNKALQDLRQREFKAGRYNPVMPFLEFPVDPAAASPGAGHASIDDAMEDADADGTRSILDLDHFADEPTMGAVYLLPPDAVEELCGTRQPASAEVEDHLDSLFESDYLEERGQGICLVLYKNGKPDQLLFAGYSFD